MSSFGATSSIASLSLIPLIIVGWAFLALAWLSWNHIHTWHDFLFGETLSRGCVGTVARIWTSGVLAFFGLTMTVGGTLAVLEGADAGSDLGLTDVLVLLLVVAVLAGPPLLVVGLAQRRRGERSSDLPSSSDSSESARGGRN